MDNQSSNPFRILWIEDQLLALVAGVKELQDLLKQRLSRSVEIIGAEWVDKAERELANLANNPPDLILLDVMLPRNEECFKQKPTLVDMNAGFIIWHRLRKQNMWGEKMACVPIVVVTVLSRPQFRPMMEADKKLKWLDKPVGPSTVADEIVKLLNSNGVEHEDNIS